MLNFLTGRALKGPHEPGLKTLYIAMGCFWGAERRFWKTPGVSATSVGYMGGYTPNPIYDEVCSGKTGHTEAVEVVYDPEQVTLEGLLKVFWEAHDPTQGMRQGNDTGTQYRSAIYTVDEVDLDRVKASAQVYQALLSKAGHGTITTEIELAGTYYYAEDLHQQYLAKVPHGYCGLAGTGVSCTV